jgi:hypothetical protein
LNDARSTSIKNLQGKSNLMCLKGGKPMICCFSGKAMAMLVSRKEEACFRIQERAKIQAIRPHIVWSPEKISDDLFR